MTPVQLPEVPAPVLTAFTKADGVTPFWNYHGEPLVREGVHHDCWPNKAIPLYTADQLRAYATEAIRQAANAIFAEGWYLACDWASRDDLKFDIDSPAFEADRAARLGNLLTQPEQNSGR